MTEIITFLFSFMVDQVVLKYLMYENIKNEFEVKLWKLLVCRFHFSNSKRGGKASLKFYLKVLFNVSGNNAYSDITFLINMRHNERNAILFADCTAIITGMGDSIDTDGKSDKDGPFMDILYCAGRILIQIENLAFFQYSFFRLATMLRVALSRSFTIKLISQPSMPVNIRLVR